MTRKGENIYKRRDGRWEGRFIKKRNQDNSIQYGYVYASNYKEVKQKLNREKAKSFSVKDRPVFYGTVEEWMDFWLEEVAKKTIKVSTFNSYKTKIENHIKPALGNILLNELSAEHLEQWVEQLKKKLSSNSACIVFRVLKTSLRYAEKQQYINRNIYEKVSAPKMKKKKIKALTIFEHKLLVKEAKKTREGLPILIALETGMRIGEISGLKWKDIDMENCTISVKRTLQRVKIYNEQEIQTQIIENKPKSEASERIIPISASLLNYLTEEKRQSNSEYVVSTGEGGCLEPRTIRYQFHRLLKQVNLKGYTFHALRHSFATRCLEKGVNIAVISSLLGHSSTKMTLDIYINSSLVEERAAVEIISVL